MAESSAQNFPPYSAEIRINSEGGVSLEKHNKIKCLPRSLCEQPPEEPLIWRFHEHHVTETNLVIREVQTEETTDSFAPPQEWLARWRDFEFPLSPLAHWVLHHWPLEAHLRHWPTVETQNEAVPGFVQIPLLSPTLPPAKHTNAYIVGDESFIVVDPATYDDEERSKLKKIIDGRLDAGHKLLAVVLTHHHADHFGAAEWLRERFHRPIIAHPVTQKLLEGRVCIEQTIDEDDRIDLGQDRFGRRFELQVYFTPGHAPGHIVLADLRSNSGAMVVGDMVAAVGTIIVDPDEGDMRDYMSQLRRLEQLNPGCLFPAHGPPIPDGPGKLQQYLRHRQAREDMVLSAVKYLNQPTLEDIVADAYRDTPKQLHSLAARSCLAHLQKLIKDNKISITSNTYNLTPKN